MPLGRKLRRSVPSILVFGLVFTGLQVASTSAVAPATAAANSPQKVKERPDRVSAMVAATAQKSRVEDLSQRTPTSATFANPNGTWTTESYSGIVRSKDDSNDWVPVDATLEKNGGSYAPTAVPVDVEYSDGGDKVVGKAATSDDSSVQVGWPSKLPVPVADGDTLTYAGAAHGDDLVVESHPDGFDYSMVLDHAPAVDAQPIEYRIPISADGLAFAVSDDGSITFKDGKKSVGSMSAPVMWDSSGDGEASRVDHPVGAIVEGTGDSQVLVLKPDMDFLRDPNTTYPVTVDPVFSLAAAGDTWVNNTDHTSSQYSSTELQVGSISLGITKARSYLAFDLSAMQAAGMTGTPYAASLSMSNFNTGSCTGSAIRVSRVTGSMSIPSITWSAQPTTTATNSATTTAAFGSASCPEAMASWNVAALVGDAMAAGSTMNVQVKADSESAQSGYRKYRSLENGNPALAPTLSVTYDQVPNTATSANVAPGNPGYATSLNPTLSAVVSDPDGGQVRGNFVVKNSGGTTVWSGTSGWTTSGGTAQVTVPSGLAGGSTYTASIYSEDPEGVDSATALTKTFTVDVTAPTATLTATGYTNNTWSNPSSNTFTWGGPSDTATYEMVFDGVPLTRAPNSGSNYVWGAIPPVVPHGWHAWTAVAVDRAGNRGPVATLNFGSDYPAFTLPQKNAVSTGSFPVDISAPPGSIGATLKWKPKGTGTWTTVTQVTKGGAAWTGSVTAATGHSTTGSLLWNATAEPYGSGTITAPMTVMLWACFSYPSAPDQCTAFQTVQIVPSAFGGNFPTADLGPMTVALFTGEASMNEADAADSRAGLGRAFSSFDASTLNTGLFGPGWSDPAVLTTNPDTKDAVVDNRTKDGSIVIVAGDSGSQTFVPVGTSTTAFEPLVATGDTTSLTYAAGTGGNPDTLSLTRPLGTGSATTKWTLQGTKWTFDSVVSTVSSTNVAATNTSNRPVFVRLSNPGASATCTSSTQTTGCRALTITYVGTGSAMRVDSIARVIGAATQSAVTTMTLATYTYDGSNRLSKVCSASPGKDALNQDRPALCTSYTYATVAGRTVLASSTPAGLTAWRYGYDTLGRLLTVRREKPTGGDATWSVDYSLTPATSPSDAVTRGLPDLSAATAAQWGQQTIPTKLFAVYSPFTGTSDVSKARLYYTNDTGTTTNTAGYGPSGWLVDTTWVNENGDEVQHLDPTGWARVQAAATADRLKVAGEASSFTIYNTWGDADTLGTRVVDEYGPAHTASLKDGTVGLYRTHTNTMYDDDPSVDPSLVTGRPSGATDLGLLVKETESTVSAARTSTEYDSVVTTYGYDPIVPGDGSGWVLGIPTKVTHDSGGSSASTAITRYDSVGNEIESRQPGGSAGSSGAGNDAHSTLTTYYAAAPGSGDCDGKPAWDGLVCKVGPAAQPSGTTTIPITYNSSYSDDLQPLVVKEFSTSSCTPFLTSNCAGLTPTRTTTTTYDNISRVTGTTKAATGSGVSNETIATTNGYDDNTGLPTTVTSAGNTISTGYDTWGRTTTYADALGTSSATSYDAAGNVATFNDGSATYAYSYDGHNLLASVDAGGGVGTFGYTYTNSGQVDAVTYPNGLVAGRNYDQAGEQTGLTYSQGSTEVLAFTSTLDSDERTVAQASYGSAQQFSYDGLGRLTRTQDTRLGGCLTRTYGFDASSNRSSFATYNPGAAGACQTTTAATNKTNTYDATGRITSAGYSYDTLGRNLTVPQSEAGPMAAGAVTATYHADDMVGSLSQSVLNGSGGADAMVMTYGLDPAERIQTIATTKNGTESQRLRYKFAGDTDSPASIDQSSNGGSTWSTTRYVTVPEIGTSGTTAGGTTAFQLADLAGNLVATIASTSGTSAISSYSETDEFGGAIVGNAGSRYARWGSEQRSTDALGGFTLMGARAYNPSTGMFLSMDAVRGGNATVYTYPQDPINQADLTGLYTYWWGGFHIYGPKHWYSLTFHIRIWINIKGLRKINTALAEAVAMIGARLAFASKVFKVVAVTIAALGFITQLNSKFIDWLDYSELGLGIYLSLWNYTCFPRYGYYYFSEYAYHKGT